MIELNTGNIKNIDFGSKGYTDYTISKDVSKKAAYIARHRVNEDWNNPLTASFWARWILWGDTTSITQNTEIIKKRFNL